MQVDVPMSDSYLKLVEPCLDEAGGMAVLNPATGEKITAVRTYSTDQISDIIVRAETARRDWAQLTAKARAERLRAWYGLILAQRDTLAALCTAECGKPLAESLGEVTYAASFIDWFAEEAKRAYGETIPSFAAGKAVITVKEPVGTCVAITPWNFPLAMITRKVGPALASGCAMIVKPAESTPLSALALEALAVQAGIPADLFRVVPSADPVAVGKLFCTHPVVRKISFTGSTPVGKLLLAQAAGTVKRVCMELGGNAPFIVFDDADLDAAIDGLMISKFRNAGQTCVCTNRVLVQDKVHDAFVEKLVARVKLLTIGNGADAATQIGPLIDPRALAKVAAMTEVALSEGAVLACGGAPHPAGDQFYQPTVLTGVTQQMQIAATEIFGPVAPVIRFADEADAIRIANDTPYGLAAYFYTRDIGRVWRVMSALEYGMVAINEGVLSTEVAPFGGIKESGLGREGSRHGLDEYLELKYALIGGLGT
jgi:succinate-semialdehyde dehydrogenase / glutarate-semialdehyde dehydrogenase